MRRTTGPSSPRDGAFRAKESRRWNEVASHSAHQGSRTLLLACLLAAWCPSSPVLGYEEEVRSEAELIAFRVDETKIGVVAVTNFTNLEGDVTELGRFLAEEFSIALAEFATEFKVVDRTHLKTLLDEYQLNSTGLIDPETALKLGKFAGVNALVTGTISSFDGGIRMEIKVLELETATIVTSSVIDVTDVPPLEGCPRPITGTPSEGSEPVQRLDAQGADPSTLDEPGYELMLSCQLDDETARRMLRAPDLTGDRSGLVLCHVALQPHHPNAEEDRGDSQEDDR